MDCEFHCYNVDDGENLHILDVRATELQQALKENNHQVYVALFKSDFSIKDFRITIYIIDLKVVDYSSEIVKV